MNPDPSVGRTAPAGGLGMTRFVARNGHRLSYATSGTDGAAIIGLHDLLADRGQLRQLADVLPGGQFRLVLPDMRGHGAAPAIAGRHFPTHEVAADLLTILDAEGIDQTHVVAIGWSAAAALGLAMRFPQRIASVALREPYLPGLVTDHADAAMREAAAAHLAIIHEAAGAADKGLTDRALDLYLGARLGSDWRQRLSKPRLGAIRRAAASLAPLLTTLTAERIDREALHSLSVPLTIFIEPDAMPIVRWTVETLTALLPQTRVVPSDVSASADVADGQAWASMIARTLVARSS